MSVVSDEKIMCHTSVRFHVIILITCTNEKANFFKTPACTFMALVKSFEVVIILSLYDDNTDYL